MAKDNIEVSLEKNYQGRSIAEMNNFNSVFDLSPTEKLQLVEDLWDDLAANPEKIPVHDWQKHELARRKINLKNNPGSGVYWEDVKQRIRNRYGR